MDSTIDAVKTVVYCLLLLVKCYVKSKNNPDDVIIMS